MTVNKVPRFIVEQEPWAKGFFTRLRSYLTERPGKLPKGAMTAVPVFTSTTFGAGFVENLKDFFTSNPAARRPVHSPLALEWKPWYAAFWENLRDTLAPPKLPPLKLTCKPVKVRDIWSKNEQIRRAQALSFAMHALLAVVLTVPILQEVSKNTEAAKRPDLTAIDISPYLPQLPPGDKKAGGGGGGGERMDTPASKGKLPKFSMKPQLTPPVAVLRNLNPKLPAEPTLIGPPEIQLPSPNLPNYGDPLAAMLTNSSGPGSGGGIGTGSGGGIGSGDGGGLGPGSGGGVGGGVFAAGRDGVGIPACIYCPNPTFSDEAVKARWQGTVLVRMIVKTDGTVAMPSVVKSIGLGLDERALEAVKTWRLKPARGPNGQSVNTWVTVEVNFRQL